MPGNENLVALPLYGAAMLLIQLKLISWRKSMNGNKLGNIKKWFDLKFKSYEFDLPSEKAIREAFQAIAPGRLLTDHQDPAIILDGAMAIDKIVKYDSYNFDTCGIVAWTFCDNAEAIKPMYEFCRSPEANLIRAMLGIEKHWFLCFQGEFDGVSHKNDYHVVKHLMDSFDELWLSSESCLMSIEQSANSQIAVQSAA